MQHDRHRLGLAEICVRDSDPGKRRDRCRNSVTVSPEGAGDRRRDGDVGGDDAWLVLSVAPPPAVSVTTMLKVVVTVSPGAT